MSPPPGSPHAAAPNLRAPEDCTEEPRAARADLAAWRAETRGNPYLRSRLLRLLLSQHAPALLERHEEGLADFGEIVGRELDELTEVVNRDENLPRLAPRDGLGNETQAIEFHPDYHRIGRRVSEAGILSDYATPGRELIQLGKYFLLTHLGESGHLCPLACTAGLIKLLQAEGSPALRDRFLPGLLDPDPDRRLVGAQFVTEVQGGSDAGTNSVQAAPRPGAEGEWSLRGEKWFCSVVHADLFLVTARVPGQGEGTRGLGCFLVPRRLPGGETNGFLVHRIKNKVGTRAFPTAEVTFRDAVGFPLGELKDGFKNVVGVVLHTSRLYNAVGCAGAASRAYLDAHAYARRRRAFGRRIEEFAPVARTLARMKALTWAITSSTFHLIALSERLHAGESESDRGGRGALRMLTNMNKYWTSVQNTRVALDGVEVLGGNGTIEEFSILPQLHRLSVVLESWEGSHNVLCAQVLRDSLRYGMDREALAEVEAILAGCSPGPRRAELEARLADCREGFARLREVAAGEAEDAVRPLVDRFMVTFQAAALLALGDHEARAVLDHFLDLYPPEGFLRPARTRVEACLAPAPS